MIIEIGRFFTQIDYSNRPRDFCKGNVPGAVGPFASGPWPDEVRKQYTLNELHRRCRAKGLMKDWQNNRIKRLILDATVVRTAISIPDRQAELVYIRELLVSLKGREPSTAHLLTKIGDEQCNQFILDYLDTLLSRKPRSSLEQADGHAFSAEELNLGMLQSLGGLRIIWTDRVDDHLRLSPSSRTLTLFWDISLLDQSLLFWFDAQCLRPSR